MTLVKEEIVYQLDSTNLTCPQDLTTEAVAVKIYLANRATPLRIINCYVPPIRSNEERTQSFDPNFLPSDKNTIICGDFNAHHTSWDPYTDENHIGAAIDDWMISNDFTHANDGSATRINPANGKGTAPDITILHSTWDNISTWKVEKSIGSDHLPLILEILFNKPPRTKEERTPRWNYRKANWVNYNRSIKNTLSDWNPTSVAKANASFTAAVIKAAREHIPLGHCKLYHPWWCDEAQLAVNKRNEALDNLKAAPFNHHLASIFQRTQEETRNTINNCKTLYWKKFATDLDSKTPSSQVWNVIRSLDGRAPLAKASATIADDEGHLAVSPVQKANLFSKMYSSINRSKFIKVEDQPIRREARYAVKGHCTSCGKHSQECSSFNITEINNAIDNLKDSSAPGPDEISNTMIKNLDQENRPHLLKLFNLSWSEHVTPASWRMANIKPIPKSGKPPDVTSSYRPISLTSCLAKCLERMVHARLSFWIESNNLLNPDQAGFRKNRGTEEQVATVTQYILDGLQKKERTVSIMVDFSRAYDTVWKDGLVAKMARMNIPQCTIKWIRHFLSDRRAFVSWGSTRSRTRIMKEGLPQGSVLAPTLWLIYMNDASDNWPESVIRPAYADDLTLATRDKSIANCERNLQPAINLLSIWAKKWKVTISIPKTTCTLFTRDPREVNGKVKPRIVLDGTPINFDKEPKLLGVFLDSQLNFGRQVREVKTKLQRRLKILRCLTGRTWGCSSKNLKTFYKAYCEPVGLYCASSWLTQTCKTNQEKIDAESSKAARIITGCTSSSPTLATLKEADIQTLSEIAVIRSTILRESILRRGLVHLAKSTCLVNVKPRIKVHGGQGQLLQSWREKAKSTADLIGLEELEREQTLLPQDPPWSPQANITINNTIDSHIPKTCSDAVKKEAATSHLNSLPTAQINIWTDGSARESNKDGGSGVLIQLENRDTVSASFPAGTLTSSFRSEMIAIKEALVLVLQLKTNEDKEIRLCTDSKSALDKLRNLRNAPRDATTQETWNLACRVARTSHLTLQWVPSHCGIDGNEQADRLANEGTSKHQAQRPIDIITAKACIKNHVKERGLRKYLQDVHSAHHRSCSNNGYPLKSIPLTRQKEIVLHQLRVGHSPLCQAYLARINPEKSSECPRCKHQPDDINHLLLNCPATDRARLKFLGPSPSLKLLHENPAAVCDFLLSVGLLGRPPE